MAQINKPSDYFNTITYNGTGTFPDSISGVGFSPEFIWIKRRNAAASHVLSDIIRGTTKTLYTDSTSAELTNNTYGWVSSFDSDGFSVNQSGSNGENVNASGGTYAAWNWLAGGTASSNTDGDITSSVSASTTSGFSIVSYTGNATDGATVGHGLSSAPQMVITKSRGDAGAWQVLTNIYPNYSEGDYMNLNDNGAKANSANVSFLPTSTTWQMKSGQAGNTASTKIALCFHSVKGFSKFGSYTGNGSTNGTFVYTGFKPAFVIVKRSSSIGNWCAYDNKRPSYNVKNLFLMPNLVSAEETRDSLDFVSNGFKLRNSDLNGDTNINLSGSTYIYMAFAENPLVGTNNIPATAR